MRTVTAGYSDHVSGSSPMLRYCRRESKSPVEERGWGEARLERESQSLAEERGEGGTILALIIVTGRGAGGGRHDFSVDHSHRQRSGGREARL